MGPVPMLCCCYDAMCTSTETMLSYMYDADAMTNGYFQSQPVHPHVDHWCHYQSKHGKERDLPVDDQNLPGEVTGQGKHVSSTSSMVTVT